jgi:putative radical SAM enzyme (TIGR03279 family)
MITIKKIHDGTLGDLAGFQTGDQIISINDQKTQDILDFQVQSAETDLFIEVQRDSETYEVEIHRNEGDLFGLEFEDMRLRSCNNKCVFCFIHQMPKGMRKPLYFEDDDFRLSFLHGSYVTLTNVRDSDIERIVKQGLTPQYISVHSTDPSVRQQLLGRSRPTVDILERIKILADGRIEMHAQVVLCPGINDGTHLEKTICDLRSFYPAVRSVAIVPLGLTKYRENLPELNPVTNKIAASYLQEIDHWGELYLKEVGERFVYGADELFLRSGKALPDAFYYDAFPQLENGIGMTRSFIDDWKEGIGSISLNRSIDVDITLVTGELAAPILKEVACQLSKIPNLNVNVAVIKNLFFGGGINVSGLLTGKDIIEGLKNFTQSDMIFLPPNCVNSEGLTLDDMDVNSISDMIGNPVAVGNYNIIRTIQDYLDENCDKKTVGSGRQLSELGFFTGRRDH